MLLRKGLTKAQPEFGQFRELSERSQQHNCILTPLNDPTLLFTHAAESVEDKHIRDVHMSQISTGVCLPGQVSIILKRKDIAPEKFKMHRFSTRVSSYSDVHAMGPYQVGVVPGSHM
jgi:hypothetical protein